MRSQAVENLATTSLMAPVYIIVGGVSSAQGAVITRDRIAAVDVWLLDPPTAWYRFKTNYGVLRLSCAAAGV